MKNASISEAPVILRDVIAERDRLRAALNIALTESEDHARDMRIARFLAEGGAR